MARLARVLALGVALAALSAPRPADAHQQSVAYGDLVVAPDAAPRLTLYVAFPDWHAVLGLDADRDNVLTLAEVLAQEPAITAMSRQAVRATVGGRPCDLHADAPDLAVRDGRSYVVATLIFDCGGASGDFTLSYHLFDRVHPGHRLLMRATVGDQVSTHALDSTAPDAVFHGALPEGGAWHAFARFFVLGVEHIFLGFDHILFLLALLFVGGSLGFLVRVVTSFTVAHSLTLVAATLGWVSLPPSVVEPAIAATICWVALENVALGERAARYRWLLTFVFGLVHGFGFASVLAELELPRASLAAALVAFNLGVEVGQTAIVAALYPVMRRVVHRGEHSLWVLRVASGAIFAAGLYWFVQRVFLD